MFAAGDTVADKYRIERLLGQGGMGAVYAAEHLLLHQRVAIKVISSETAGAAHRERFLREARAASRVRSEHVTQVFDVGELPDGTIFMVLELLDGLDFARLVEERGRPPVEDAVALTLEALLGVAAAHASGVVHRDLKLENLFVARRPNGSFCVKVLDFGISKSLGEATSLTASGAMVGSPYSMSPEQIRDAKSVDARSDIWSMGVVLYMLVTGLPPFNGDDLGAVVAAILEAAPRPLSSFRPEVDERLQAVVTRALSKTREGRFGDVADFADALAPFAGERGAALAREVRRALGTMGVPTIDPGASHRAFDPAPYVATAASGDPPKALDAPKRSSLAFAPTTDSRPGVNDEPTPPPAPGGTLGGVPLEPAKKAPRLVWAGVLSGAVVATIALALIFRATSATPSSHDAPSSSAANATVLAASAVPAASSSQEPSSAPVVTVAASASANAPFDAGALGAPAGHAPRPTAKPSATSQAATPPAPSSPPPQKLPASDPLFDQGRQ